MKKRLGFYLAVLAAMELAIVSRLWQRTTAFEPESGLLTPGMPATWCVMAVVVLAAAGFFLLGRYVARDVEFTSYLAAFSQPIQWMMIPYMVAGAMLVAAGVLGVTAYTAPEGEKNVIELILGIALVPTGGCVVVTGWAGSQKEEAKGRFLWPLLAPGYCACVWMIRTYQLRSIHPNVMGYGFILFGGVCAAAFCYVAASFSFERPRPLAALWLGGMSLVLLGMAGADLIHEGGGAPMLTSMGYGLYVLCQTVCLVWRCEKPAELVPWTPPEDPEEVEDDDAPEGEAKETEEVEGTDHE